MKKLISLMIAMLLTFSMVGCGNGKENVSEAVGENITIGESVPETESENMEEPEVVENTMEEMYNLFGYAYELQDIVYDESGLNKSDEILGFSLEDAKVNIKSKGIVISIPGNVQDFLNINSAIEWEVDSEIVNAGESVAFTLPIPYSSAVSMMVKNPTDRELSATECVITSISANAREQRVNELDYFDLEFPGGIRIGAPLDSEKVIAEFGECSTAETPDRIEYDWIADNCSLHVNVDKATNLVDWVYVSYFGDDVEYVEPTITQKTPYTSIAENMNVVAVDAQKVADGTNEEVVYYIGNQELRMPCTTQELLDKTGLLLPSEYLSYTVEGSMYMADIPLFNEDGVKCLVIKVLSRNYDPVSDCEVIEVAQAINEFIPQELILTETPQENGQQAYYVKMLEIGDNKIKAISVYRDHTGAELTDAKDAIESAPAVIWETTDLNQAQALIDALTEIGATMDADMLSSEIVEVSEEADNGVAEYEGFLQEVKLFNHAFKTIYVNMYMPMEHLNVATDKNIYRQHLLEQDSYVLIGGQPSMGAPRCEDSENILEFYVEQVYTEFNKIWSAADDFEMEIASKEAMTVNEHSMWKYNGTVKGSTTNGIVKEYPFVAYATTAEDTSIFWLLADDSENKDQMETLEKQAQTMAQSYTIK